jgi:hypothetical protein
VRFFNDLEMLFAVQYLINCVLRTSIPHYAEPVMQLEVG